MDYLLDVRGGLLSLLLACCLVACSSSGEVPPIANATQLVKDGNSLIAAPGVHQIPSDQWPASIKALNPVYVSREEDGLHITTYAETGEGARGYVITPTAPTDNDHFKFSATAYPGIYRFDFTP